MIPRCYKTNRRFNSTICSFCKRTVTLPMNRPFNPSPKKFKDAAPWLQKIIRDGHELWFGEFKDCEIENHAVTRIKTFVYSIHGERSAPPNKNFNEDAYINKGWLMVEHLCHGKDVKSFVAIVIETGVPVRICVSRGGWRITANGEEILPT